MRFPRLGRTAIAAQLALASVFVVALLTADGVRPPGLDGGRWTVRVAFADAGGLRDDAHAPVTVAGVPMGRVAAVRYDPDRGRAVATLRLDDEARGVLRADATASVVPRSTLQDLTVELSAGDRRGAALDDGDWLTAARTAAPVGLDEVVGVLDADTRAQAQILLAQLAVGVRGRSGPMRAAIGRLRDELAPAGRIATALAGRRRELTRLTDAAAGITGALAEHDRAVAGALRDGRRTLGVVAGRTGALRETVAELPAAMASTRAALDGTRALAADLSPALDGLQPSLKALPRTLDAVRDGTPDGRRLLRAVDALARDGAAPLADARALTADLPALTRRLTPALRDGNAVLRAVDEHRDGIGLLGERFSGVLSTSDANGVILRGLGFFEAFDPAHFGAPGATGTALVRVKRQAVAALVKTCLEDNAVACLARYAVPGLPGATP